MVNDRFGRGSRGKHGGVYCSEAGVRESGTDHKWCEDRPISRGNWSYNRLERLEDYLTERDLIHLLVETVALGGNLHLDDLALCGRHDPDAPARAAGADGRLAEGQRRSHLRHKAMDRCLGRTDGRIGQSSPGHELEMDRNQAPAGPLHEQGRSRIRHLSRVARAYAETEVPSGDRETEVRLLGHAGRLDWKRAEKGIAIQVPACEPALALRNAWVFKLTGVKTPGKP